MHTMKVILNEISIPTIKDKKIYNTQRDIKNCIICFYLGHDAMQCTASNISQHQGCNSDGSYQKYNTTYRMLQG